MVSMQQWHYFIISMVVVVGVAVVVVVFVVRPCFGLPMSCLLSSLIWCRNKYSFAQFECSKRWVSQQQLVLFVCVCACAVAVANNSSVCIEVQQTNVRLRCVARRLGQLAAPCGSHAETLEYLRCTQWRVRIYYADIQHQHHQPTNHQQQPPTTLPQCPKSSLAPKMDNKMKRKTKTKTKRKTFVAIREILE